MSFTADYLLVHEGKGDRMLELLWESLQNALEESDLPVKKELVEASMTLRYSQPVRNSADRRVSAFRLEVDVEDELAEDVLQSFHAAFIDAEDDGVLHVLKFGDPLLKQRLAQRADELFDLEMSLREALSAVFLIQYGDDFYNLLQDVAVNTKENPDEQQMKTSLENEFFHLLFSQYTQLSERKGLSKVGQLLSAIGAARSFEDFRREMTRQPIEEEYHRDFITSLQELMDAIERTRNCVAHNRTVPKRVQENYPKARDDLRRRIEEFLERLSDEEIDADQEDEN